jgi:ubiquinone/menaquinone biosynthesis C-methylase UbiE
MNELSDRYDHKFNGPDSEVRADVSWERYFEPTEKRKAMRERYDYSISKLYGDVLDVGCGDGFGMFLMSQNANIESIIGLEIHDKAISEAIKNLENINNTTIIKGIAEKMPFDRKFDCIHCGHTLEHVFDDKAVLTEIRRLLKGTAVISVPIGGGISLQHVREYTVEGFITMISEYFEIIEMQAFIAHTTSFVAVCS